MSKQLFRWVNISQVFKQLKGTTSWRDGVVQPRQYHTHLSRTGLLQPRTCSFCLSHHRMSTKKLISPQPWKDKTKNEKIDAAHAHGREVVTIFPGMTPKLIASATGKPVQDVFTAMQRVLSGKTTDNPNLELHDTKLTGAILHKMGFDYIIAEHPERQKKHKKERRRIQHQPETKTLVPRPPVVTIMGHVDHGKTTLLDKLRSSNVVDQEFGGITQHIGAFSVKLDSGASITFLDTPGHAVFSAMRARGAHLTDIIVLVVAADDGVMQQTVESINHAKEANVPVIVAINKIDKYNADLDATKRSLLHHDIMLEEFGGDIQAVPISALKGTNLDELQESIIALAEILELCGDPEGHASGRVVEARTDVGMGKCVTAVIQKGKLKKGAILVAGGSWAKVRNLLDERGKPVKEAGPSQPVEILGWKELPSAGEEIIQVDSEKEATALAEEHKKQKLEEKTLLDQVIIEEGQKQLSDLHKQKLKKRRQMKVKYYGGRYRHAFAEFKTDNVAVDAEGHCLPIVLKGDVDGSVEAILDTLETYDCDKCSLDILQSGVGNVTQSDIEMADAFNGEIFAFNVTVSPSMYVLAKSKGVPIHTHNVIYKMFDHLVERLNAKLPYVAEEEVVGKAKVLQMYSVRFNKKTVHVAGCRCVDGSLMKRENFKVVRDGHTIFTGKLQSLKHLKEEVESIKTGVECGLTMDDPNIEFRDGDMIICYKTKQVSQTVDWELGF